MTRRTIEECLSHIEKGFAKLSVNDVVLPIRKREERPVVIDARTTIMVSVDDVRTAEEIRSEWKQKQAS